MGEQRNGTLIIPGRNRTGLLGDIKSGSDGNGSGGNDRIWSKLYVETIYNHEGTYQLQVGGLDPMDPPSAFADVRVYHGVAGEFALSTGGDVFMSATYVRNSGTSPTVAVYGQTRATGAGSHAWGANFAAYTDGQGSGTGAVGCEINHGLLNVDGANVKGLTLAAQGHFNSASQIDIRSGSVNNVPTVGIAFESLDGGTKQPCLNVMKTINACSFAGGIDFSNSTFTGRCFKSTGHLELTTGRLIITTPYTPSASNVTGTIGMITWDTGFIYVCTATDTWERAALAPW